MHTISAVRFEFGTMPRRIKHVEPVRPTVSDLFSDDIALPGEPSARVKALAERFVRRLGWDVVLDMRAWFFLTFGYGTTLNMATSCSGTDMIVDLMRELLLAVFDETGAKGQERVNLKHVYACEGSAAKRQYIRLQHGENVTIFNDVKDLTKGKALTHDHGLQKVDRHIHIKAAGFPCTDASTLNNKSGSDKNLRCIETASLRTGSVFESIVKACELMPFLKVVFFENVAALQKAPPTGKSNLDHVESKLKARLDHFLMVWELCPRLFGTPQSRSRLWMASIPEKTLVELGYDKEGATEQLTGYMDQLVGSSMTDWREFLIPDNSDLIRSFNADGLAKREMEASFVTGIVQEKKNRKRPFSEVDVTWPTKHQQAFEKKGRDWAASSIVITEDDYVTFPGLARVRPRELDTLALLGIAALPEKDGRMSELVHSAGRCRMFSEHAPTVLPGNRIFFTDRCRFMHPVECMALQGIKVSQNIAFKVKPSTMQSLAGNSFEASCALATMFATFAFLAKGSETTLQAGPATYAIRNGIALDWRGYPIDEDADL